MTVGRTDIHHQAEVLAAGLPPLLVAAERVAATVSQGVHGRRRVGQGETFWQFRRYQPGDAVQSIDWRQSAKRDPLFVRENEWEAAQSVWLWRDSSPSMRYRSSNGLPEKSARADILLLALASLLARGGEHVALLGSAKAPAPGRAALRRIAAMIDESGHNRESLPRFEPVPRYGRVVIIGDFLVPLEELRELMDSFCSSGVRGHLLKVMDPAEETLPFQGRVIFEGLEGEREILLPRTEAVRGDYRKNVAAHHRGLAALAGSSGWTFASHRTDHAPETALLALFQALSRPLYA